MEEDLARNNVVKNFNKHTEFIEDIPRIFIDKKLTLAYILNAVQSELEPFSTQSVVTSLRESNRLALLNTNVIFEYCESPIEQIFINSVNISFFREFSYMPVFTPPILDTERALNEVFEIYKASIASSERTVVSLNDSVYCAVQKLSSLHENRYISKGFRHVFEDFLLTDETYASRYDKYHFTIQSSFPDLKIDNKTMRVDLLIWKPSDEEFKLIVECDGFIYHSNKDSFINDLKRDRILKAEGYDVFRFSGTEINKEPFKSGCELIQFLRKRESRQQI
jgi:very-short-patch-repair endonuclease